MANVERATSSSDQSSSGKGSSQASHFVHFTPVNAPNSTPRLASFRPLFPAGSRDTLTSFPTRHPDPLHGRTTSIETSGNWPWQQQHHGLVEHALPSQFRSYPDEHSHLKRKTSTPPTTNSSIRSLEDRKPDETTTENVHSNEQHYGPISHDFDMEHTKKRMRLPALSEVVKLETDTGSISAIHQWIEPRREEVEIRDGNREHKAKDSHHDRSHFPNGIPRANLKDRKRTFSKRTKTGCLTCRQRKKKCDEGDPVCDNCTRGNFTCLGYNSRTSVSDAASSKGPSRTMQNQPVLADDHSPSQGKLQEPAHHASVNHSMDYSPARLAARDWTSRHVLPLPAMEPRRPIEFEVVKFAPKSNSSSCGSNIEVAGPPPSPAMTEKEKMLVGRPYGHYIDRQLIQERKDCALRLELFNKAHRPSSYSSVEEMEKKFRAVLQPPASAIREPHDPIGSCGTGVIVEAPFNCDYGYNIHIGDDVVIQRGCDMQDPCKISVGDRTIIGPGVRFLGLTTHMDPALRRGARSLVYGGSITVEEDCVIGGGVTILPFRTIGKGAFVGAGTVVSKDVQAHTVVAGNPMKVIRDIDHPRRNAHKRLIQQENDAALAVMVDERRQVLAQEMPSR